MIRNPIYLTKYLLSIFAYPRLKLIQCNLDNSFDYLLLQTMSPLYTYLVSAANDNTS